MTNKTIKKLRDIRKNHQAIKVQNVLIDVQTANVILEVYDSLKSENKKKFLNVTKGNVSSMASLSWDLIDRMNKKVKDVV